MRLLGPGGKQRLFEALIAFIISCIPPQLVEDSMRLRDEHSREGRKREKGLAFVVECQASCWLSIESLRCCDPDLSSLMLFWPFMKTFTEQYIRSFVHSI